MEMTRITAETINKLPRHLHRPSKAALAVGANVWINKDHDTLQVKFDAHSDMFYFDPENATLHAFELLGVARKSGFLLPFKRNGEFVGFVREQLVIRIVHSVADVRVQIGVSKWFHCEHDNTAYATRHALMDAFCGYFDEGVAPYYSQA